MRSLVFVTALLFGFIVAFASPSTPTPIYQDADYAHYDVQIHNRDNPAAWDGAMAAQHGANCSGPPATHTVSALGDSVYICNGHVMTAANSQGYGMIALTPSQTLNCSAGCTVQFDLSTERMSGRDWPDIWLTPWNDNLTLPFNYGDVDLQGVPRQGIHVSAEANQNSWCAGVISNYNETKLGCAWWVGMHEGVQSGVNQSAQRQTFKLTVTPGHMRFERLASATATGFVWVDIDCACLLAPDYVVQFAHHSYNPTKDGAGIPATWHWSGFGLNPATPFTLIHTPKDKPTLVTANNTLVSFDSSAPANAFLRFSGVCKVLVDGNVAPKQTFIGHYEHASSYFVPIAQGKQSVSISFAPDSWYSSPCYAQDFAIFSKSGGAPSTPTPTSTLIPTISFSPVPPTSTSTVSPSTSTPTPAFTVTPLPTATALPPTSTPTPQTYRCQVRNPNGSYSTLWTGAPRSCP